MTLALMQPYLFPYLGYYQLVRHVDVFVMYDDVTFIKQGYINRNQILHQGAPSRFTVPVPGASSNRLIRDLSFSASASKLVKTISQSYARAPFHDALMPGLSAVLTQADRRICSICSEAVRFVMGYLGLPVRLMRTSELDYDRTGTAADRIIAVCKSLGERRYVNSIGGMKLYEPEYFAARGIELRFLKPTLPQYPQGSSPFVPSLSIIDVLMWCPPSTVAEMLSSYEVI